MQGDIPTTEVYRRDRALRLYQQSGPEPICFAVQCQQLDQRIGKGIFHHHLPQEQSWDRAHAGGERVFELCKASFGAEAAYRKYLCKLQCGAIGAPEHLHPAVPLCGGCFYQPAAKGEKAPL